MFSKWFAKDERGSIMIVVALSMVVLLGFAGLAVDFGAMAMTKQELQNAADAAALAAGYDRANGLGTATATASANDLITANGYVPNDGVTVSDVSFGANTVTVTISTQTKVSLSGILTGRTTETVSAKAVVEIGTAFNNFPYAMFAGQEIKDGGSGVVVTGNNITIQGNVHSNSNITMKATITDGVATALGDIKNVSGETAKLLIAIEMPSVADPVNMVKSHCFKINGDVVLGNGEYPDFQALIDKAATECPPTAQGLNIYITGSITSNGNDSYEHNQPYPINLVVGGHVNLNGCTLNSTESAPIMLVSETGDVTVNGGGAEFAGLVIAPQGDVTINGNNAQFTGSIVAQNIRKSGGKITVTYSDAVDDHFPKGKVRLIA